MILGLDWFNVLAFLGVFLLILAFFLDFKQPKHKRIQWFSHDIPEDQVHRYAPLYTKKDRLKQVMWLLIGAIPVLLFVKFIFNPWVQNMEQNFCKEWMGISVFELHFFGMMLMLYATILGFLVVCVRQIIQIKKSGQFPLPGKKTMSLTKIVYGKRALIKPVIGLVLIIVLFIWSVRIYTYINQFINENQVKVAEKCEKLQKAEKRS